MLSVMAQLEQIGTATIPVQESRSGADLYFFLFTMVAVPVGSIILGRIGWKTSVTIQKEWLRTFVRAGVLATVLTPTLYGHFGPVQALWALFMLPDWNRLYFGAYPILFTWILGFVVAVIIKRIKRRKRVLYSGLQ